MSNFFEMEKVYISKVCDIAHYMSHLYIKAINFTCRVFLNFCATSLMLNFSYLKYIFLIMSLMPLKFSMAVEQ